MGQLSDWILAIMAEFGYLGIVFAMFIENVFPPIPSEIIMSSAGFAVGQGKLNFTLVVIAGTFGTVLGTLPMYYLGQYFNIDRLLELTDKYGKYIFLRSSEITSANDWFNKHGKKIVLFGRMIPGIRTLVSIPAGMNNVNLSLFLLLTTIGSTVWVSFLTFAGYHLGKNYNAVEKTLAPYSKGIVVVLVVGFSVWLLKRRADYKRETNDS